MKITTHSRSGVAEASQQRQVLFLRSQRRFNWRGTCGRCNVTEQFSALDGTQVRRPALRVPGDSQLGDSHDVESTEPSTANVLEVLPVMAW
jgi:hypothetical protein